MPTNTLEPVPTTKPVANGATPKPKILTRAAILAAKPFEYRDVPADEYEPGAVLRVKPMDYDTRTAWQFALMHYQLDKNIDPLKDIAVLAVARCVIDEDGNPQFTDEDIKALAAKDARPIDRAWDAIRELSKDADLDKQVEDAAKNSDGSPSGARSTG